MIGKGGYLLVDLDKLTDELISCYLNTPALTTLMGRERGVIYRELLKKAVHDRIENLYQDGLDSLSNFAKQNSEFQSHAYVEKIARDFYTDPVTNPVLYHYTSIDILKQLVQTRTFYMGSAYYMNDPQEIRYTYDLAKNYLEKNGASEIELKAFESDTNQKLFDSYIWSFSTNDHSQALQNYGDVAIGLKSQNLQYHLAEKNTKVNFEGMSIGNGYVFPLKVIYDEDKQLEYVNAVAKEWLLTYRGLKGKYDLVANDIALECLQALFLFSLCFKNSSLYQEEETRFLVERIKKPNEELLPDEYFRGRPVIKADFTPDMVSEIIVTHKNGADKKKGQIRQLLNQSGFTNITIRQTELPY